MEITKIAAAVDFSPESECAVEHALRLSRHAGAELVLIHVGHILAPLAGEAGYRAYRDMVKKQVKSDRGKLAELRQRLVGQGVEVSEMYSEGFPDEAILEMATESKADLLVMGTHGRTGLKRFLLGSIAEKAVRTSSIPVLVTRSAPRAQGTYRRVLIPTEFSSLAAKTIAWAGAVADSGAEIDLFHAWHHAPLPYAAYETGADPLYLEAREEIKKETLETASDLLAPLARAGFSTHYHCEPTPAGPAIIDRAPGYDLIVMGSHGRRGASRLLLGSVAESTIRYAPCSVLVVREGPPPVL